MKIPFNQYDKIRKMSYNEFDRWFKEFSHGIYQEGIKQGESELDNASVEQWTEFISNTPGATDTFSVWDYDKLRSRLAREFTGNNVDRIMDIITEGGTNH